MKAHWRCTPLVLVLALVQNGLGSPFDELSSVVPSVRSQAAETIRTEHLYKPSSNKAWSEMVAILKNEKSSDAILKTLHGYGAVSDIGLNDLRVNGVYTFRLDADWALRCAINQAEFDDFRLINEPKEIWVEPPPAYTGLWRCYRRNGDPMPLVYCSKGLRLGSPTP
jgi:hypothetical protein